MDDQVLLSTMTLIALLANARILDILALQKATPRRKVFELAIRFQAVASDQTRHLLATHLCYTYRKHKKVRISWSVLQEHR